jgi:phthiocerol/phenolphthiocerol synthesis type-I polyketide synthase E
MDPDQNKIAVIGMACRFPGANNLKEFWSNLIEGRDTIKHFTDEELAKHEYDFENLKNNPDYVKARGVLSDIDKFDAGFFGMTPREAAGTDPQHRIWLETAWEALENAGCDPFTFPGAIGVFAGGYLNTYLLNNILRDKTKLENYIRLRTTESFQILTGNDIAFIPTKTAYKFNLRGPAVNVQTACSTSLVSISLACQSLFSFESDICIAGGVCVVVPQESGYLYQEGAIPSPDGKCRPFDENGKGTVFSNGVGVVVLKRTVDAIRDKDRIYACVRGWALNNDGNNKVSYMAPSVDGQAEAIMMAQSFAEVSPRQIGYVEAHGTATKLGDPIELSALSKAFRGKTSEKQYCGIGSVKSNIGHTDAAAGVASFIKCSLAAYYKIIPPSINYNRPNSYFDFENSPFFVQDKLRHWDSQKPLIMGISSFGIGGTNAHVIIEEPPANEIRNYTESEWTELLILSARSESALNQRKQDLLDFVSKNQDENLKNIAFTLQYGRSHMQYRTFCALKNVDNLKSIEDFSPAVKTDEHLKRTAFMFSGQGAQYAGMGQELYIQNKRFRNIMDECFGIFNTETGFDLKEILFDYSEDATKRLTDTSIAQPALFIVEYALAKLYEDLGIRPDYLIGHSIGEYVAACISGVFDLETALKIVIRRGQLMQSMPSGKMMAVRCSIDTLRNISNPGFEIAAENSDNQCTISFNGSSSDSVKSTLEANGIRYIPLNTSHAFHSSAFDPVLNAFSDYVNSFRMNPPEIPMISCLTGDFITPKQAASGDYWSSQMRHTVRFKKGISTVAKDDVLFLEIGPDTHLTGLAKQNHAIVNKNSVVSSLGRQDEMNESQKIISSLGSIWAAGINVDFRVLHVNDNSFKVDLPSYPFQKQRYWIDYEPSQEQPIDKSVPVQAKVTENSLLLQGRTIDSLKDLLCEISGHSAENIREDLSFGKMGFDSLFLTQYAKAIERKFKVKIEFIQLIYEVSTLKALSEFVDANLNILKRNEPEMNYKTNGLLHNFVKFQPEGTAGPLIILHGQNADKFIPDYLGKDHPYYGFLHPGSDGEAIKFKSVEEMAGAYLEQLLMHKPSGPYYLGGFSFGGVLAFEMAVQLTRQGHEVPFVILFDSFACEEPFRWHKNLYKIIKSNILVPPAMKAIGLIKRSVCEGYLMLKKPTPIFLRSFYIINKYARLIKTYKPGKYEGRVILFRAIQNASFLKYLGWDDHAKDIKVIPLNAGHLTILKNADSIERIQTEIKSLLDSCRKN